MLIFAQGKFIAENMRKADITKMEVYEDLRAKIQTENIDAIEEMYVEKNGEISFIVKPDLQPANAKKDVSKIRE